MYDLQIILSIKFLTSAFKTLGSITHV